MKDGPSKFLIVAAVGTLGFFVVQYLSPAPDHEAAKINCTFDARDGAGPLNVPYSSGIVKKIEFSAEMRGRYTDKETGIDLWHADGEVRFEGGAQLVSGAIFLSTSDKVTGMMLYRDRYPRQAVDLRISTLDESGNLDWDDTRAYVYFEGAVAKLDHPFEYRCNLNNIH